jgi:hypothetical protein
MAEMGFLGEKPRKKMSGWIGNSMSIGGSLIKIDSCLSSVVVYHMSMRLLHKTNTEEIDIPIKSFFWDGSANKRKYHFANPRKRWVLAEGFIQI